MRRLADRKRAKHKKKIAAIEKRYPVFGLLEMAMDSAGKLRLGGQAADGAASRFGRGRRDPDYAEMMSFLDEID